MIPGKFEYHAPTTVADAVSLLGQYGDDGKLLAGGHSLLPMMKLRFAEPAHLIDLNRIEDLRGVRDGGDTVLIGAMTVENDLIAANLLWAKCPLVPEAAKQIADPQVRSRGTIGGDICHGDPGNDHPAIMMAVDATFVVVGPEGERKLPANGFYLGTYWTQLEESEVLTEIQIPAFNDNTGWAYHKLKRKTGDWATAASAVVLELDGDVCSRVNIALTNVGATALKAEEAEAVLAGQVVDENLIEQAAQKAMAICDPAEDLRGDVEYKTHMAGEMTRRAIRQAVQRARG